MPLEALLPFLGFALFINYQNEHARHFRGASQTFYMLLIWSVVLGWVTGLVYLVWLGFVAKWWSPFAFLGAGTLLFVVLVPFDRYLKLPCAFLGFIGWPICAVFMFVNM